MADILELGEVSYVGEQANEVMMKPAFFSPSVEDFFTIIPNIKYRKQLALDEFLENIIRASSGCSWSASGGPIDLTEKWLEPCDIKVNLEQCARDLQTTFMTNFLKAGNSIYDLTGTEVETYILKKVVEALQVDIPKLAWFGDTDLDDDVLEICDGIWPRLLTSSLAYGVEKGYSFGDSLSADEALAGLRAMTETASDLLDGLPASEKYIAVTRSVWENYLTTQENTCCGDRGITMLSDGTQKLTFRGIEVRKMSEWDRIIAQKGLGKPHRALYTTKSNLIIGTDIMPNANNSLEMWYERKDRMNYIEAFFTMSTEFLYNELTVIAY